MLLRCRARERRQLATCGIDRDDANGNPVHVKLDEAALLNFFVRSQGYDFENAGEVLAAGAALQGGDPVPLLRLGAEGFFTLTGDSGIG